MSVNAYITELANNATLLEVEREGIQRSIDHVSKRLNSHFADLNESGGKIIDTIIFGSYSRGTILPRIIDEKSDVDYMIVFENDQSKPQTYLNRLRRFAEKNYPNSICRQSLPTIQLDLQHIRLELVPAVEDIWSIVFSLGTISYKIPNRASEYRDWISTDPKASESKLSKKNANYHSLISPLIRLLKYWNVREDKPFSSYELEQMVLEHDFSTDIFIAFFYLQNSVEESLWGLLLNFTEGLTVKSGWSKRKKMAVSEFKKTIKRVNDLHKRSYPEYAESEIRKVFPPMLTINN